MVWRLSGFAFFVRLLRWSHFLFIRGGCLPAVLEKEKIDNDNIPTFEEINEIYSTERILNAETKEIDKKFYHYTKSENLVKIFTPDEKGNRFFYISNLEKMNDVEENELHEENANKIHSFCTCCTSTEKIPLWYLYSGVCGNGARIGFPPLRMLWFLKSIKIVYPVINNKTDYKKPLFLDKDFEMECGWVCYFMRGNKKFLYRNNLYSVRDFSIETKKSNFFIKEYPWEYEREFRIVIKNKTEEVYDKLALHIPEKIISMLDVTSAPEQVFEENLKTELISLGINATKIKASNLKIKMNILQNNKKEIIEHIDEWFDEECYEKLNNFLNEYKESKKVGVER